MERVEAPIPAVLGCHTRYLVRFNVCFLQEDQVEAPQGVFLSEVRKPTLQIVFRFRKTHDVLGMKTNCGFMPLHFSAEGATSLPLFGNKIVDRLKFFVSLCLRLLHRQGHKEISNFSRLSPYWCCSGRNSPRRVHRDAS
jgi:hypothetical protein